MKRRLTAWAIGICLAAGGCAEEEPWELSEGSSSSLAFQEGVYPVLLRDCAFFACHGSSERLFQVWGPKRKRLFEADGLTNDQERARVGEEMLKTFDMAISFVDINDPSRSLLLRKGLDAQAGGTGHLGLDRYGRNVYRSGDSPGYLTLSRWVYSLRKKPE
jgi:hypothetical protein